VRGPFTLGQFFAVWGAPFGARRLLDRSTDAAHQPRAWGNDHRIDVDPVSESGQVLLYLAGPYARRGLWFENTTTSGQRQAAAAVDARLDVLEAGQRHRRLVHRIELARARDGLCDVGQTRRRAVVEQRPEDRVPGDLGQRAYGRRDVRVAKEKRVVAVRGRAHVRVCTGVDGYGQSWKHVLDRFFSRYHGAVAIGINDFGATPGMVALRLQQALEASRA